MLTGRQIVSILLLGASLVCGYLFLAGFEYPGVTVWKIVTGSLGVLLLTLALFTARRGSTR